MTLRWLSLFCLVGFAACTNTAVVTDTAQTTNAAQQTVSGGPAMWRISDADTHIYLFGTVHVLPKGAHWYTGNEKDALDAADTVVLEITDFNDPQAIQEAVSRFAPANDQTPLSDKLDEATFAKLSSITTALGLPLEALNYADPWYTLFTLSVVEMLRLGYDPSDGVEMQIVAATAERNITLANLETTTEQLEIMDSLAAESQLAWLQASLDKWSNMEADLKLMYDAWQSGDDSGLANLMNDALLETPDVYRALLTERNARWADWLQQRLEIPGKVFVAVGAGHLAGDDSVQAFLARHGIVAQRVN